MPILDHFGLIAPLYERMIGPRDETRLMRLLGLPTSPSRPFGWLLDVGGGTGRVAQALQPFTEACVLADESIKMLGMAVAKPGLHAAQAHAEHLPFSDNTFDYLLMVDALHHVADQPATLRELWRVCKPGGRIVVEEPDVRRFMVKLVALGEKLLLMRSHFLTPPAIQALFPIPSDVVVDDFNALVVIEKPA